MRFSKFSCGVFAIVVGLCPFVSASAQTSAGQADRLADLQKASEDPVPLVLGLRVGQDRPANAGGGETSADVQLDRRLETDSLRDFELAWRSQSQQQRDQSDKAALDALADLTKANQGANGQGQSGPRATWIQNGDALRWFARRLDRSAGINLVPVDDALRSHLKLPKDQGLLVAEIDPHSRAAQAGLKQNDVLLKLGDSPLATTRHFDAALKAAGDKPVVLHLYRDGKPHEIHIQPQIEVSFGPVRVPPPTPQYWIGVSVADVEPALRAQLRLAKDQGLLINQVFNGPAEKAGIKVNDILLAVNGTPLANQQKLVELVQTNGAKILSLELLHEGKPRRGVEVTPELRKMIGVSVDFTKQAPFYRWNVIQPGAVLDLTKQPYQVQLQELGDLYNAFEKKPKEPQPKDQTAALSKRLDEMQSELEKVLKALAEVNNTLKATEELKQAIELLKKAADKK